MSWTADFAPARDLWSADPLGAAGVPSWPLGHSTSAASQSTEPTSSHSSSQSPAPRPLFSTTPDVMTPMMDLAAAPGSWNVVQKSTDPRHVWCFWTFSFFFKVMI